MENCSSSPVCSNSPPHDSCSSTVLLVCCVHAPVGEPRSAIGDSHGSSHCLCQPSRVVRPYYHCICAILSTLWPCARGNVPYTVCWWCGIAGPLYHAFLCCSISATIRAIIMNHSHPISGCVSEPLSSDLNVNFVCLSVCLSWTVNLP